MDLSVCLSGQFSVYVFKRTTLAQFPCERLMVFNGFHRWKNDEKKNHSRKFYQKYKRNDDDDDVTTNNQHCHYYKLKNNYNCFAIMIIIHTQKKYLEKENK